DVSLSRPRTWQWSRCRSGDNPAVDPASWEGCAHTRLPGPSTGSRSRRVARVVPSGLGSSGSLGPGCRSARAVRPGALEFDPDQDAALALHPGTVVVPIRVFVWKALVIVDQRIHGFGEGQHLG